MKPEPKRNSHRDPIKNIPIAIVDMMAMISPTYLTQQCQQQGGQQGQHERKGVSVLV